MGKSSDCHLEAADELLFANYALSKRVLALIAEITRLEAVYAMRVAEQRPDRPSPAKTQERRKAAGRQA